MNQPTTCPAPFFSIVLPTWNRAGMLQDALESLCGQTFSSLEVIVVDNHSTDDTPRVVQEFGDERVHYHRPAEKLSQLDCYIYGWRLAKGTYSGTLDDDNVLLPHCLEKMAELARTDPTGLVCFNRELIYHVADHPNPRLRNMLRAGAYSGGVTLHTDVAGMVGRMYDSLRFEQPYPGITNSFCRTDKLKAMLAKHADPFPGKCVGGEEIFSILALHHFGGCTYVDDGFCVYGESGRNSTAQLVSGSPEQEDFKQWYDQKLAEVLQYAPVKLPLYVNFNLYGLLEAKKLLHLPNEIDWKQYYLRCFEYISHMHVFWQVNPEPLLRIFWRDLAASHPLLCEEIRRATGQGFLSPRRIRRIRKRIASVARRLRLLLARAPQPVVSDRVRMVSGDHRGFRTIKEAAAAACALPRVSEAAIRRAERLAA